MSKLRVDELESLATGKSIFVDEIDSGVRADLANPDNGAAMVARGVVAVDSIADLMALPEGQRKEGLRYLVKGYHAGSDAGGGEFYWDHQADKSTANGGTIVDPHAAGGYDGTPATLLGFLSEQGSESGYGVYVRLGPSVDASCFGLVSGRGKVDVGAVVNHMLGSGILDVVLPHGDFSLETQIRLPADCHLRGSGVARTRIFAEDSFGNSTGTGRACIITDNYTGLEHSNVLDNIHLSDFFIDGRAWDRAFGLPHSNIGSNILLAGVKNSSVRRVRTVNGGMHCLDLCASAYQKWVEGSGAYTQPLGMSHDVVFEDVIAENPRGDDPITAHNSHRVQIIRCRAIYNRELHGAPFWTCNGIEIDEGCHEVHVLDCYSYGGMVGYQAKSHSLNTHPAYDVVFENCIAENVGYGFHVQGANLDTADALAENNFRSVRILNCKTINVAPVTGYLNQEGRDALTPLDEENGYTHPARPLMLSGYSDVKVVDLVISKSPLAWIPLINNLRKVVIDGITVDCYLEGNPSDGLVHVSNAASNVRSIDIRRVYSHVPQDKRAVVITPDIVASVADVYWPRTDKEPPAALSSVIRGNYSLKVSVERVDAPGWKYAYAGSGGEVSGYGFGDVASGELSFSASPAGNRRIFQAGVAASSVKGMAGDTIFIHGDGLYLCLSGTTFTPSSDWTKLH